MCTGDKKNKPRTTIIYTTEREDKIIDSESCVNGREWLVHVNMNFYVNIYVKLYMSRQMREGPLAWPAGFRETGNHVHVLQSISMRGHRQNVITWEWEKGFWSGFLDFVQDNFFFLKMKNIIFYWKIPKGPFLIWRINYENVTWNSFT